MEPHSPTRHRRNLSALSIELNNMSALAARRAAAAAASGTSTPVEQETVAAPAGPSRVTPKALPSKRSMRTPQEEVGSSRDSTPKAGPSKRRKVVTASQAEHNSAEAASLDSPVASKSAKSTKTRTKRVFSPSRPVADYDDTSSQDGRDSSDEEDAVGGDTALQTRRDMEWSTSSTPAQTPGPSRYANPTSLGRAPQRRPFKAKAGSNVRRITAAVVGLEGDEEGLLVSMQPDESLMLSGCFSITPLHGSISIFSTVLVPSRTAYPVFAPASHPLPVLSPALPHSPSATVVEERLASLLDEAIDAAGAVFFLRELSTGIEGLTGGAIPTFGNSFAGQGYQGIWDLPPAPSYPYTSPQSWESALAPLYHLSDGGAEGKVPVVLVEGPKRSGKSTIAKAALNALLARYLKVAWLECDLGQSEFAAGGVVGLWVLDQPVLGPAFTHPRVPHRAHFLGSYTAITCPDEYLAAIHHLVEYYKYEIQYPPDGGPGASSERRGDAVPLVINTPGWVKGLGEDLLRSIEGMIAPKHTFQFPLSPIGETEEDRPGWTSSPPASYAALPTLQGEGVVVELEPAPVLPLQARYAASDYRALSTLAYYYSHLPSLGSSRLTRWNFGVPLAAQSPYEIAFGEAIKEVYLIGEGADGILLEDLPLALNGSIVALLERLSPHSEDTPEIYVQGRSVPPLYETNFVGYAFIRALSTSTPSGGMKLHVLTPLPADILTRVSVIVRNGAMEMPNPGLLDFRNSSGGMVPFFDDGPVGVGGERRKIRRNLMRKGA